MYILLTVKENYFVEYLFNSLIISDSITEAMIFQDIEQAKKFKQMLQEQCKLKTSISTFIK